MTSVIIPTRNRAAMLAEAVESVLAQDCRPLEIIVVDDGSTDGTATYVKTLDPLIVKYVYNPGPAHGVDKARNLGLGAASGRYIAWLDDDDRYLQGKLTAQRQYLDRHPEAEIVFCGLREFTESPDHPLDAATAGAVSFARSRNWHASMLARADVYAKVGLYKNIAADGRCDQDWLYRAHFLYGVSLDHCVEGEFVARRLHPGSFSYSRHALADRLKAARTVNGYIRAGVAEKLRGRR